jgi:F0F1-type ATP synthase delta subunit
MKRTPHQYAEALTSLLAEEKIAPGELAHSFLTFLKRRGEGKQATRVLAALEKRARNEAGTQSATVEVAHAPDEATQKKISQEVVRITGSKNTDITYSIKEDLLSGYRIMTEDLLLDQSGQAALKNLKNTLTRF